MKLSSLASTKRDMDRLPKSIFPKIRPLENSKVSPMKLGLMVVNQKLVRLRTIIRMNLKFSGEVTDCVLAKTLIPRSQMLRNKMMTIRGLALSLDCIQEAVRSQRISFPTLRPWYYQTREIKADLVQKDISLAR